MTIVELCRMSYCILYDAANKITSIIVSQLKRYAWCLFVNNSIDPVHLRTDLNVIPPYSTETHLFLHSLSSYIPPFFHPFMAFVLLCGCSYDIGPYGGAGWA